MICRLNLTCAMLGIVLAGTSLIEAHAATAVRIQNRQEAQRLPFTLVAVSAKMLTDSTFATAEKAATNGVVSSDKKTISFSKRTVRLVVHTGPDNDMLSYRIDGLRNPTLVIPHGSTLKVLFVNTDEDMFHNIRFGVMPRSFSKSGDGLLKTSVGTAPLAHIDGTTLHGAEMVIKVPGHAGKYGYFCTVRGHAPGGMWGTIQVR